MHRFRPRELSRHGWSSNRPAPACHLTDPSGAPIELASFRGKAVVLDFWFYACVPCRIGLPQLEAFAEEVAQLRDDVVFVCVNPFDDPDVVQRFWAERGFTLRAALSSNAAQAFGVREFPKTYLIDPRGRVQWHGGGEVVPELRRRLLGS